MGEGARQRRAGSSPPPRYSGGLFAHLPSASEPRLLSSEADGIGAAPVPQGAGTRHSRPGRQVVSPAGPAIRGVLTKGIRV